jgi:hypothetical protein
MPGVVIGIFMLLHGLVHLWYFTLSRGLVEFQPDMGWTGRSWLFTNLLGDAATRALASVLYVVATGGFVSASIGILSQQAWWRPVTLIAAIFSTIVIILFWDGSLQMPVQKGLLGVLINSVILVALLLLRAR